MMEGIRLQVEAYGIFRFICFVDVNISIQQLRQQFEKEILDLYDCRLRVLHIKDSSHNDLQNKFLVRDLFKDMDQVYIFVTSANEENKSSNKNEEAEKSGVSKDI